MRIGRNPAKDGPELSGYGRHRIIIPVYIPRLDGYFEHSLEVLKLCLESLKLSVAGKANVTIVSNGSSPEVVAELDRQYRQGWIDQLLLNRENRGKVDAVVSAARGAFEEFITISDCDVLFKIGWLRAVENIFHNFPECGFVSPMPTPNMLWRHTSATILGGLARRELAAEKIVPEEDLLRFAKSIGSPDLFKQQHKESQFTVRRNGVTACVGCGHFVCTIRKVVLKGMPEQASQMAIEGKSEELWLDRPPDKLGLWRLATTKAYVYHMGNSPEAWMREELGKPSSPEAEYPHAPANGNLMVEAPRASVIPYRLRILLLRFIQSQQVRRSIFTRLGYPETLPLQ